MCVTFKSIGCFHKQKRNKNGVQAICKECRRKLDATRYKENSVKKDKNKQRREKRVAIFREYKSRIGCLFCLEKESVCLDFHHVNDNKEFSVMNCVAYSMEKVWAEIEKCILICANCHRKIHAGLISYNGKLLTR